MSSHRIVRVETDEQLARYAAFPREVYRGNPYWPPADAARTVELISGRSVRCETCQVQPFWAERGGRIAATVTAVIDDGYNHHWNETLGHFVSFEALPDSLEAVQRLVDAASNWVRERGCNAARSTYLGGWELPMTIDAYDQVPSSVHGFNPPYYHGYLKSAGFETERGMVQYQVELTPQREAEYRAIVHSAERRGVHLRIWNFDRIDEELRIYGKLFNAAFAEHWGVGVVPEAVFASLADSKDDLIAEFNVFAEVDGETVGIVGSPPDLNQALHAARHQGFDRNSPEFRQAFDRIDHGILLVIGLKKQFRGRGIAPAMAAKSYLGMIERGYRMASYTPVLDDNWPSRSTAERLGCHVARNFVIYRRNL